MLKALGRSAAWTLKTFTFLPAPRHPPAELAGATESPGETLIYRLRHWPRIPSARKTAALLRTLSVMSHRPVNRRWILNNSRLDAGAVDSLLRRLMEQGAVEVIDVRGYRADTHAA